MNNQGPEVPAYEDEIDLRELLLVLWRGRWLILGFVLVAAVATWVGGHLLLSPTYEATATLLIVPPTYQTSIEPEPLALDTYRELARTPALAQRIVEELGLTDKSGQAFPVLSLLRHMDVRLSAPETNGGEAQRAGVLHLDVTWHDPEEAEAIANAWAQGFMDAATSMRRSEANEVAGLILRQFSASEQALHEAENELLDFREGAQLALAEQTVALLRTQVSEQQARVLSLEQQLRTRTDRLQSLNQQLEALQDSHGRWIGLQGSAGSQPDEMLPPGRRSAIEAARTYRSAQEALDRFEQEAQIASLEQRVEQERQRLASYRTALAEIAAEEPQVAARQRTLAQARAALEPTLSLERSIPDTALWLVLGEAEAQGADWARINLVDEEPNPNYQYVERQLLDTQVSLATIPDRVAAFEAMIAQSETTLRELDATRRELLQERRVLQDALAAAESVYEALRDQYLELDRERAVLVSQIDQLRAELAAARDALAEQETVLRSSESELLRLNLEEARRVRDVEMATLTYRSLREHAGAAQLTELTATGDVRFLSPAVVPTSPSGPRYLLNVAVAAVLAGFLGIFAVLLRNVLRQGGSEARQFGEAPYRAGA